MINFAMIAKIVNIANAIRNPKDGISKLLGAIQNKNPQMASELKHAMDNGAKPSDILKDQIARGNIDRNAVAEVKQGYAMAKNLGLGIDVPDKVWNEFENSTNEVTIRNNSGFNGF